MSLYNLLFGRNPAADTIVRTLGLTTGDFARFRDAYVRREGDVYQIVVHTRLGGGNRECWCDGDEHSCYESTIEDLQAHPLYLYDVDDEFDSTYADFVFNLPEAYAPELRALADGQEVVTPSEKWQQLFKALER